MEVMSADLISNTFQVFMLTQSALAKAQSTGRIGYHLHMNRPSLTNNRLQLKALNHRWF